MSDTLPKSVLIIDDDLAMHQLYKATLTGMNLSFTACDDGWAGYKEMKSGNHHLALLDLTMPAMTGLDMLRRLNEESVVYPPTIVISGNDEKDLTAQCLEAGAMDFLKKPVRTSFLKAAVRDMLGTEKTVSGTLVQAMGEMTGARKSGTLKVSTDTGLATLIYNQGKLIGVSYAGLSRYDALDRLKEISISKIELELR